MPFGLKNAPATFKRLISQEVLAGMLHDFTMVYLDDIIVYSSTPEEHLRHLALVLERLDQFNLQLGKDKCSFGRTSL